MNVLYVFSGTGNSLVVARRIADALGDCAVRSIAADYAHGRLAIQADTVGIVTPLYYLGAPAIVKKFLDAATLSAASYRFAVATKGMPHIGGALMQIRRILRKKGADLDYGAYALGPDNDITFMEGPEQEKIPDNLRTLEDAAERIAGDIRNRTRSIDKEILPWAQLLYNTWFRARVTKMDRRFSVNDRCNACRICEKMCPVGNIKIQDGKPVWNRRCQMCLGCFNFCPRHAIAYKEKNGPRYRYAHPGVTAGDLIEFTKQEHRGEAS
jgi:ferredoxin